MTLKRYSFGYGHGTQEIDLPEEKVLQVINGNPSTKIEDVRAAAIEAMRNPIGTEPLQEIVEKGDKVAIVVSDITRSWIKTNEFLPAVVDELNLAGVPDEDIFIVVAQGTHRAHTHEEDVAVCSQEVVDRVKIFQHFSTDEDNLVYLGTTKRGTPAYVDKRVLDADKVILTGGITVHLMAGFGGGRKSIMPGVSGYITIQKNHSLALADEVGAGASLKCASTKLEDNPLHEDMCEVAEMVNPCFLVNSVMNAEGEFSRIVAGHWYDAWLEGTKDVMKIQGVAIKEKADVVIASPGGFPKDINMYQGSKTYDTAGMALKPGGILIAMLECPDVKEPPAFIDSFRFEDMLEFEKACRADFSIPFFIAFTVALLAHNNTVYLVTKKENFDIVRKTGQIPVESLEEAWKLAQAELAKQGKTDYTINIMPHAANTVPMINK